MATGQEMSSWAAVQFMTELECKAAGTLLASLVGEAAAAESCAAPAMETKTLSLISEMRRLEMASSSSPSSRSLICCWDPMSRSSCEPQLAAATEAAGATSPHTFSSLAPGVAEGRQGSLPDKLTWRASGLCKLLAMKAEQCWHKPGFLTVCWACSSLRQIWCRSLATIKLPQQHVQGSTSSRSLAWGASSAISLIWNATDKMEREST